MAKRQGSGTRKPNILIIWGDDIDGYSLLPFLKGEVKENPRKGFLYWSDDGD